MTKRYKEAPRHALAIHTERADRIVFPRTREWEYSGDDGIAVSTQGIPVAFREAFLRILVASRTYYRRLFGPQSLGWVEFNVRKANSLPLRLWTNGADRVFLTLSRRSQLYPPAKGGARHMFGLPHELGHIVLYRSLINLAELPAGWGEGWATYLASFVAVPHLYATFGPDLWPYAYNYLETEGPGPYLRRTESARAGKLDATLRVVRDLYSLERRMGREGFCQLVREMLSEPIRATEFQRRMTEELKRGRRSKS